MGKIQKTDAAGKTVEAWWALLFADGSLGQFIVRWGWPVIGGGAGAWVASVTDWISSYGVAGWAATITIGSLAAIWGVAGFEHIRSKRWSREHPLAAPEFLDSDFKELIDARLNEFLATTLRAELTTHVQTHAFDEKLVSLSEKVKGAQGSAQVAFDYGKDEIARLEARIADIAGGCANLERKINDWTRQHSDTLHSRFRFVDGGFAAIFDREWLNKEADDIEKDAAWLLRSSEGEKVDDWGKWSARRAQWLTKIDNWAEVADKYRPACQARIHTVPHRALQGEWPEPREIFPNDDAMLEHRAVAIQLRTFKAERKFVEDSVISWAYQSPSMKGRVE